MKKKYTRKKKTRKKNTRKKNTRKTIYIYKRKGGNIYDPNNIYYEELNKIYNQKDLDKGRNFQNEIITFIRDIYSNDKVRYNYLLEKIREYIQQGIKNINIKLADIEVQKKEEIKTVNENNRKNIINYIKKYIHKYPPEIKTRSPPPPPPLEDNDTSTQPPEYNDTDYMSSQSSLSPPPDYVSDNSLSPKQKTRSSKPPPPPPLYFNIGGRFLKKKRKTMKKTRRK